MPNYTLAIGTHDPRELVAPTDTDAIRIAVTVVLAQHDNELRANPQEVVTLLGPEGLLTRPGERLDEFAGRVGVGPAFDNSTVQPGDTNTPDCNGD